MCWIEKQEKKKRRNAIICEPLSWKWYRLGSLVFFSYNNQSKELVSIPPIPGNGRIGFGLAATDEEQIIGVGGHDFNYQTMTNVAMLDTQTEKMKWEDLPDMPSRSLMGGKGMNISLSKMVLLDLVVSVIDNVLYIIGGFDFLGRDILCNG